MKRLLLAALLLGLPVAGFAQASAVPTRISYQGKVTDAGGNLIGAGTPVNRVITFRIWNSPTAVAVANRLYSEQQTVTIANGEFSVLIGAGTAVSGETNTGTLDAVFNGDTRFLGLTIDDPNIAVDPEISPRQQIVANAFSFRAKVAESVANQAVTSTMLANNAVNTAQVADAAVTLGKLAANSVDSTKIADNAVGTSEIATGAVTAAKLGSDVGVWSVNGSSVFRPVGNLVGLGTNVPSCAIDVYDTANPRIGFHTPLSTVGPVRGLFVGLNNGGAAYLYNWENTPMDFGTNGITRHRIEADGRFGWGVLNGDANLDFYFKGARTHLMKVQNGAGAEVLTVRDYGSVAIGHAAPTARLDIYDQFNSSILLHTSRSGTDGARGVTLFYDGFDANNVLNRSGIWSFEPGMMDFATNNVRRMRIENDGRMGFGIDNGDGNVSFDFKARNTLGTHVALRVLNGSGGEVALFFNNGAALKPGGGSWAATSDIRLKTDVRDLSGALDQLMQLRSVNFLYKDQTKYPKGVQTGFIAQEMEKVFPQWVLEGPDGMKAISFSGFESLTVQALRELRAEKDAGFAARDARIAALEQQVRDLQSTSTRATDRLSALERRLDQLATRGLAANAPRE